MMDGSIKYIEFLPLWKYNIITEGEHILQLLGIQISIFAHERLRVKFVEKISNLNIYF
jgi:hypothetical protein